MRALITANYLFLIVFYFCVSCGNNNTCGSASKVIYNLGFIGCDYLVEINGVLYEPNNLNEWQTFLLYIDTIVQFEMIDDAANCIILHAVFVRDIEMRHTMHYAFVNYIHAPIVANKFAVLALSFIL